MVYMYAVLDTGILEVMVHFVNFCLSKRPKSGLEFNPRRK